MKTSRIIGTVLGAVAAGVMVMAFSQPTEAQAATPKITNSASTDDVVVGDTVKLSGHITYASKHRIIYIKERYLGSSKWRTVKRVYASKSTGNWSTTLRIGNEKERYYRVYIPKHRGFKKAYSRSVRVNVESKPWYTTVPFGSLSQNTDELSTIESRVSQAGVDGQVKNYRYINGKVVSVVTKQPVPQITQYGTADPVTIVRSISPSSGPVEGGNTVKLKGILLAGVTKVMVGDVEAADLVVVDSTTIHFTAPVQVEGTYPVSVYVGDTMLTNSSMTYTSKIVPSVDSVSKSKGDVSGGDTVTITGKHLDKVIDVQFDGASAAELSATSSKVTLTTPAHGAGTATMQTLSADGVIDSRNFAYTVTPKAVLSDTSGPLAGGDTIHLVGTGLSGTTKVTFTPLGRSGFELSGMPAIPGTNLSVTGDVLISVTTPQNLAGPAEVAVTGPNGTTVIGSYTYKSVDRSASTFEQQVLNELNAARSVPQTCGSATYAAAGALSWDPNTADFALAYSKDSVLRSSTYLSVLGGMTTHNWPGLPYANWKFWEAGWEDNAQDEIVMAAGTNVSAKSVVSGWLASSAHCEALMRSKYTKASVGQYGVSSANGFVTVEFR